MSHLLSGRDDDVAKRPATLPPSAQNVLVGRQADILADVAAPGVAAAIWQRNPDASFQAWIESLPAEQLPSLRVTVPVPRTEQAIQTACDIANVPPGPERDMLAGDVGALSHIYGQVLRADYVQIRLGVSCGVMCPQFHLDNVPARMLCTYRGPGTQYVPEFHRENPGRISTMNTGAVGLFRGAQWDSAERSLLLHRSPPAEAGAGPRLLMVIDAAD